MGGSSKAWDRHHRLEAELLTAELLLAGLVRQRVAEREVPSVARVSNKGHPMGPRRADERGGEGQAVVAVGWPATAGSVMRRLPSEGGAGGGCPLLHW